jgi:chromosome segregation protein
VAFDGFMRLKQVRVSGFKSFVDPTVFSFPSNLVAVVGPNGCGKSNLVDAIRLVLGESARSLRGEALSDVVFNGSSERKPVAQAMVELVFEGCLGQVQGPWGQYDELAIKRCVTRESESVFSINNTRCRRRDVLDVLCGTGLGPRSYAVIEQGMISRFIEAKPDDMRKILEEAAGVTLYKERRHETGIRISHARDNLARLGDILQECQSQCLRLEEQARVAQQYQTLLEKEQELTLQLLLLQRQNYQQEEAKITKEKASLEEEEKACKEGQTLWASQHHAWEQEENSLLQEKEQAQQELYRVQSSLAQVKQQCEHQRTLEESRHRDREESFHEIQRLTQRLEEDLQKYQGLEEEYTHLLDAKNDLEVESVKAQEAWDALDLLKEKRRLEQEYFVQARLDPTRVLAEAKAQKAAIDERLQRAILRYSEWQREKDAFQDMQQLDADIAHQHNMIQEKEEQRRVSQQRLEEILHEGRLLAERETALEHEYAVLQRSIQETEKKRAALDAVEQATTVKHRSDKQQRWLVDHHLDQKPRLFESLTIVKGWERAVERVIGDFLQGFLLDNSALLFFHHDDRNNLDSPVVIFQKDRVCLRSTTVETQKTTVADLIHGLHPDFVDFLGLKNIYCADNLLHAEALLASLSEGASVITPEGYWCGQGWVHYEPLVAQGDWGAMGVLERSQNRVDVEAQWEKEKTALIPLDKERLLLHQKREHNTQEQKDVHAYNDQCEKDLFALKEVLQTCKAQQHYQGQRLEQIHQACLLAEKDIEQGQQQSQEAEKRLLEAQKTIRMVEEQYRIWEQEEPVIQQRWKEARQYYEEKRAQYALHQKRLSVIETTLAGRDESEQRLLEQKTFLDKKAQDSMTVSEDVAKEATRLAKDSALLEEQYKEKAGVLARIQELQQHHQHKKQKALEERQKMDDRSAAVTRALLEQCVKAEGVSTRFAILMETLTGYENWEAQSREMSLDISEGQCAKQLDRVRKQRDNIGAVNGAALEELQPSIARKTELEEQIQDVTAGLLVLEEAIANIDKEMAQRLQETFEKIHASFSTFFPQLFGGGRAALTLTTNDILTAGIQVHAKPPGKRNSTITQLSGGEKALTAVALVFSIFHLHPSPFCIFDEVDAPLDEANVLRFCRILREMSQTVQCVVITHNKVTMEMADILLGVTMSEPGVSRLVGVNMDVALA